MPIPHHESFAACRYHFIRYLIGLLRLKETRNLNISVRWIITPDERYQCGCRRNAQFYVRVHDCEVLKENTPVRST